MYIRKIILGFCLLLSLLSCSKDSTDKGKGSGNGPDIVTTAYNLTKPELVFGFVNQKRYSYCPSALLQENGDVKIWFCGNERNEKIVDVIYQITEKADNTVTGEKKVLWPSLSWDSRHTCDPCVVEGEFLYSGTSYRYAMFFLSNPLEYYYNEIGVAFSNDLDSDSWVKYPQQIVRKPWSGEGDQILSDGKKSWGVGQPSAFSVDKKGKVVLTYTIGDVSGTRVVWRECDFSDMSSPKIGITHSIPLTGLKSVTNSSETYLCNTEFAINEETDKIVMIRPVNPHPKDYPNFIAAVSEIDYMDYSAFRAGIGTWKCLYRITRADSGFPRNHNACLLRDNFGHIADWETPTAYFTVSKAAPDVAPEPVEKMPEWTYHIYKATVTKQ